MALIAGRLAALAAPSQDDLREAARRVARFPGQDIPDTGGLWRLAVVAENGEQLRDELAAFADSADAPGGISGCADRPFRLAMLFTGQGSQYPGMGEDLYRMVPGFRRALDRCADCLYPDLPLLDILFGGHSRDTLRQTRLAQPALFALEYAATAMWAAWGIRPYAVLGHSVGEYVAACVAGCCELEETLRLVGTRGRLMQSLPSGGAMASAVGPPDAVRAAVAAAGPAVAIAAVNGPNSLVLSGPAPAVADICGRLTDQGVMTQQLTVSHAFHSSLMDPILEPFEQTASKIRFRPPQVHLVCNLTGCTLRNGEQLDARYWRRHLREPVLFEDGVQALGRLGCTVSVEVGPKPTLTAMARKCLPRPAMTWLATIWPGRDQTRQLLDVAASLYVHGANVNWARMAVDLAGQPGSPAFPPPAA
jgi:acyl transferase domain-containing protein